MLYEHCSGTWEDWFKVGPECLMEDFSVMQDTISRYNGLYPLWLNQAKDLWVMLHEPGMTPEMLHKKYIKLAQGFLKDAKDWGLMVPPRVTVTVGELSAYKARQTTCREDRRKRAASRRQERGEAAKTVSFQVDEMAGEEEQQLGARARHVDRRASTVEQLTRRRRRRHLPRHQPPRLRQSHQQHRHSQQRRRGARGGPSDVG